MVRAPMVPERSMQGKVCLVTGATNGIGRATALGLAERGAAVIVHGRDIERTRAVAEEIRAATGNERIDTVVADFAELAQVRAMARLVADRHPRLHVLVNNAALSTWERRESADGHELHLAVNHLAPFLLTNLVLPTLTAGAPSRIVNVASAAHARAHIHWDDLELRHGWGFYEAYGQSKLMNVLFTRELARRLAGTGVTANALHPGVIGTNLTFLRPVRWLLPGPRRGARTSLFLSTSPSVDGVSGTYFAKCRPREPSKAARDDAAAERLWAVSARMVGL